MKKILVLFSILLLGSQMYAETIAVPRHTNVKIKIKTPYDSKQIHRYVEESCNGQRDLVELQAVLAEDLIIDNNLIASKGNAATIKVENYYKAKTFGRGGYIKINGGEFEDNNGFVHRIDVEKTFLGENDIFLTRVILFNRGKQAKISTNDIMDATTAMPFNFNVSEPNYNSKTIITPMGKKININKSSY